MSKTPHYLFIGNGRISRHFQHYFKKIKISYSVWSRSEKDEPLTKEIISDASHILLLISDSAIDPFIEEHPIIKEKIMIHFSGSYQSKFAVATHPLQTFNHSLYSIECYKKVAFILNETGPEFNELFPQLSNKYYRIPKELRAYYHSLCVMANNFSCLLWQKLFSEFEDKFNISREAIFPFMEKSFSNLQENWETALTGPFARRDNQAVLTNLNALKEDPYNVIFKAFIDLMRKEVSNENC